MKKKLKGTLLIVLLPILLISCEQIFTYSIFEWAQRDPANLSEAQQISYAKSVLGSGDQQAMADAYEAIKDSDDPDVQLLASKLAVGASGINEAVEQALADLESGSTSSIQTYIESIDKDMLGNAVEQMSLATEDTGTADDVTSEEYLTIAAANLIYSVDNTDVTGSPGTIEDAINALNLDPPPTGDKNGDWDEKTIYYLEKGGYDSSDLDSMLNYS